MISNCLDPLDRAFYDTDPSSLAPQLLNKVFVRRGCAGRIVEVEAYDGSADPASHAFRGRTARNAVMFGPPGHLYVYFIYGMHYCCNVVCREEGVAGAVLIRALAPLDGIDEMRGRRDGSRRGDRALTSGPARLCQALAIDRDLNGADLVSGKEDVWIADDGVPPPSSPAIGSRIGIGAGLDYLWRFWVPGDLNVSAPNACNPSR